MLRQIYENIVGIFTKSPEKTKKGVYIKYYAEGGKIFIETSCPKGEEQSFADTWILATSPKDSDNILLSVKDNVDTESYNIIVSEVKKVNATIEILSKMMNPAPSGPIVKPSEVFRKISDDTKVRQSYPYA